MFSLQENYFNSSMRQSEPQFESENNATCTKRNLRVHVKHACPLLCSQCSSFYLFIWITIRSLDQFSSSFGTLMVNKINVYLYCFVKFSGWVKNLDTFSNTSPNLLFLLYISVWSNQECLPCFQIYLNKINGCIWFKLNDTNKIIPEYIHFFYPKYKTYTSKLYFYLRK